LRKFKEIFTVLCLPTFEKNPNREKVIALDSPETLKPTIKLTIILTRNMTICMRGHILLGEKLSQTFTNMASEHRIILEVLKRRIPTSLPRV